MIRKYQNITDGAEEELHVSIKRCRIYTTPGQLRLLTDIQEVEDGDPDVTIEMTDDPVSINIHFINTPTGPVTFSYTVPKFYPHQPPVIRRLLPTTTNGSLYAPDGKLLHHKLNENWSVVDSLRTSLSILRDVLHLTTGCTTEDMVCVEGDG